MYSRSFPSSHTSNTLAANPASSPTNGSNNVNNNNNNNGNNTSSYYSHSTSAFQHPGNRTPSSHLHVLQNPPQTTSSTTNLASTPYSINSAPSPSSRISLSNYQTYGSTHGGGGQEDWNDVLAQEEIQTTSHQMPLGIASSSHLNPSPRTIVSHGLAMPTPPGRPRSIATSARHDSNATQTNRSAGGRDTGRSTLFNYGAGIQSPSQQPPPPNWGLFGRQLSQVAGDVSTAVRQNEILISLMERLVDRIENATLAGLLQQNDDIHKSTSSIPNDGTRSTHIRRPSGISNRPRPSNSFLVLDPAPVHYPSHQSSSREADVRQQPPPPFVSHGSNHHNDSASYLDDGMDSTSFDFIGNNRNNYATSQQRIDTSGMPSNKRNHQDLSNGNNNSSSSYDAANTQGHPSHPHHHHQHKQSNADETISHNENYNGIRSPVFANNAPIGQGPNTTMTFDNFYSADDVPSRVHGHGINNQSISSIQNPNHRGGNGSQQQAIHSPVEVRSREETRSRLNTAQGSGMGLLEEAGIVPSSSLSSLRATPALPSNPSGRMEYDDREVSLALGGDDSTMDQGMVTSFMDDDKMEPANDDWKLWLEPRNSNRRDLPKAKYRSAKQVKIDRKEKTKRSLSTIGRIPLKEYLEVGSDYKLVRRVARSVYNTWLALNVRLAKQDPDRLMACYHKLEYDFPILADCEDHWKAKELMLQVIDNAIDEIAFHRRKEERRLRQDQMEEEEQGGSNEPEEEEEQEERMTKNRRDAAAADLYTSGETGRSTRRKKGLTRRGGSGGRGNSSATGGLAVEDESATISNEYLEPPSSYGTPGILTRSAAINNQHAEDDKDDWTATGEEANMFAQTDSYQQQQQQQHSNGTNRASSRRSQQISNQVSTPGMSAVW